MSHVKLRFDFGGIASNEELHQHVHTRRTWALLVEKDRERLGGRRFFQAVLLKRLQRNRSVSFGVTIPWKLSCYRPKLSVAGSWPMKMLRALGKWKTTPSTATGYSGAVAHLAGFQMYVDNSARRGPWRSVPVRRGGRAMGRRSPEQPQHRIKRHKTFSYAITSANRYHC